MIEILQTPPLNSVQDLGRTGQRVHGIARSGAADRLALSVGNVLLGNEQGAAGIEVQMGPMRLRFQRPLAVALCGADCQALLNERPVSPWSRFLVDKGDELYIGSAKHGLRAYLCVSGGIDVPQILGSRSTYFREQVGGHEGRMLRAGDCLPTAGKAPTSLSRLSVVPPQVALPMSGHPEAAPTDTVLRVVRAGEYDDFTEVAQQRFWREPWTVTPQSSRMGYRLEGSELARTVGLEMRSYPIMPGVVQVPPAGRPIIQLVDGNSAGGYPKIGYVIEADLWRVAQSKPGQVFRFVECSVAQARQADIDVASYLADLVRRLDIRDR